MVNLHLHKLTDGKPGPCEERSFEDMETFVKIYNYRMDAYGSTRLRFLSINDHYYVEGKDQFHIESVNFIQDTNPSPAAFKFGPIDVPIPKPFG